MQLTLEALAVIAEIDHRGSFASAAEHLNKVPSSLSYIVQKQEEQLGVTLFQRQGRRSVLTPAGRHLLTEGKQLLETARRVADQTREIATGWEPRIRIAIDTIVELEQLLPTLQPFIQSHPQIELDITEEALGGTWEALTEDRADLLIGAGPPIPPQQGIRSEPFGTLEMVFAVAPDHPLASIERPITRTDLAPYTWIVVHDSSRFAAPRDTGRIGSDKRHCVHTMAQKIAMQRAGMGVGYLPRYRIQSELQSGQLIECSVDDPTRSTSEMLLAWKGVNRGKGVQALVQSLKATPSDR